MTTNHGARRRHVTAALVIACVLTLSGPAATAAPPVHSADVPLLSVGSTATLSLQGRLARLGKLGGITSTVEQTPSGDLVVADNILKLISPAGKVRALSGKATVDGFAVSPDGHYVAWSVSPGSYRDKSPYQLFLYDLRLRKLVHSKRMPDQVAPVGFLDDGRVGVQAQGTTRQSYLWRPATGALRKVGTPTLPSVDRATGHLLVLSDEADGCSAMIEDTRTGRTVALPADDQCEFLQHLSPDGSRWWSFRLSAVGDRLVGAPGTSAAATGKPDLRLAPLFFERMGITDAVWLGNDHLLVIAQAYKPGATVGRQLEELCAVPVDAAPSCTTVKDLGRYERPQGDGPGPSIGPDVWLAHPLGQ